MKIQLVHEKSASGGCPECPQICVYLTYAGLLRLDLPLVKDERGQQMTKG